MNQENQNTQEKNTTEENLETSTTAETSQTSPPDYSDIAIEDVSHIEELLKQEIAIEEEEAKKQEIAIEEEKEKKLEQELISKKEFVQLFLSSFSFAQKTTKLKTLDFDEQQKADAIDCAEALYDLFRENPSLHFFLEPASPELKKLFSRLLQAYAIGKFSFSIAVGCIHEIKVKKLEKAQKTAMARENIKENKEPKQENKFVDPFEGQEVA